MIKFLYCIQEILMFLLQCMLYNLYDIDDNIAIMVYILVLKISLISVAMTLNIMASE